MFKVGDNVIFDRITDSKIPKGTLGVVKAPYKGYSVVKWDNCEKEIYTFNVFMELYVPATIQTINTIFFTSSLIPTSFKQGVLVESIADNPPWLTANKIYAIEAINKSDAIYVIDDQGNKTPHYSSRFRLAASQSSIVNFSNSPNANDNHHKEIKPCTCESLSLMRNGCQCGAIIKKTWGLR